MADNKELEGIVKKLKNEASRHIFPYNSIKPLIEFAKKETERADDLDAHVKRVYSNHTHEIEESQEEITALKGKLKLETERAKDWEHEAWTNHKQIQIFIKERAALKAKIQELERPAKELK